MTMPHERTRSVVQAREFLEELRKRADLPESVRREAHRLLRHYPSDSELDLTAELVPMWWGKPGEEWKI